MAAVVVDPGPLARLSLRDDAGGVAGARESLDVGGDDGTKPWQRSGSYDFDRRPRRYPYRSRDAFVSTPPSMAFWMCPLFRGSVFLPAILSRQSRAKLALCTICFPIWSPSVSRWCGRERRSTAFCWGIAIVNSGCGGARLRLAACYSNQNGF